jgi:hypothetical protein
VQRADSSEPASAPKFPSPPSPSPKQTPEQAQAPAVAISSAPSPSQTHSLRSGDASAKTRSGFAEVAVELPDAGARFPDHFLMGKIPVGAALEILEPIVVQSCRLSDHFYVDDAREFNNGYSFPGSGGCSDSHPEFRRVKSWRSSDKPFCEIFYHPQQDARVIEKGRLIPIARTLGPEDDGYGIYLGFDDPILKMMRCASGPNRSDESLTAGDLYQAFRNRFRIVMAKP